MIDVIPTGQQFLHHGVVVRDGRFDAVDSVPRLSPSMIGFGFNTRLLLGGKIGGPNSPDNPRGLPMGENLCEIAFNVHRMLETQGAAVAESPVYLKLFEDAYPVEAASFARSGYVEDLGNDDTIERADAARGGANVVQWHSGPMLNKQLGDEAGLPVEENVHNLGVGDHPLQRLSAIALEDPSHHDIGRGEITLRAEGNVKFRTMTLRQVKDSGGQLIHSALFGSVREVNCMRSRRGERPQEESLQIHWCFATTKT